MNSSQKIVTRFAPSPTGLLHMGNYRTAVFGYLYAKKHGGELILRIEDTDRERSKKEYEDNILESLEWLGIKYDRFFRQSENLSRHTEILNQLINEDKAYISKEEAKDGSGLKEIVRFRNPNKKVVFDDLIRGTIETDTTDLGDFVIAKSVTEPLFHLAVVVDDHDEGVTHVIRGEDHIPNTPRQILIREALNWEMPAYAHLPLVLAEDRTKLSKRKGAKPITYYRDEGYLKDAVINFMALIGWNPGTEQEVFKIDELIKLFSLEAIHKGGAICNEEKLLWFNKEHILLQSGEEQLVNIKNYLKGYSDDVLLRARKTIIERITHYGLLKTIENDEFIFLKEKPEYEKQKLHWKMTEESILASNLEEIKKILSSVSSVDSADQVKSLIFPLAEERGKGEVLWPLRVSLSGKDKSADPFTLIYILGLPESISRIEKAIDILSSN